MPELASLLPLLFKDLPAELLSEADRAQLQKLAANLPLASGGLLEIPVSADGGPVGLGLRLVRKQGGFDHLENAGRSFKPGAAARPAWKALQQFAIAAHESDSPLRRGVAEGWLEFDLDAKTKALPAPGFFFKLEDPYRHPATAGILKETQYHSSVGLIQQGLDALGVTVDEASIATLIRCIRARSASTGISYIGVFLGRKTPGFRLVLGGMPFSELTAYLRKIEYAPGFQGLLPLTDIVWRRMGVETLALQLDIAGNVQPRLGFEVAMNTDANPAGAWASFLEMLIYSGLSTPARARAIPAWHRQFIRTQVGETWPKALGTRFSGVYCTINHVKFTHDPGPLSQNIPPGNSEGPLAVQARSGEMSAKAYLAFQYASSLPHQALWSAPTHE
jgi:hypothetical protein